MKTNDIIEKISEEMVCENACPQFQQIHYEIEKCTCYKKEVIESVKELGNKNG